jgi:NAD(P)-dependent dehydrogenase (short-subunit alcohol dehydrogenase family)
MRILIVGASGELGTAVARRLAKEGHQLVLHAHSNLAVLNRVADELDVSQRIAADVTSEIEVRDLIEKAADRDGIDGIVYTAGVNPTAVRIADTTLEDWNRTLAVNLTGAFLCVRAAIPFMRERHDSSIVIVSSVFGITSPANRGAYGSSKHGIAGLVESVAREEAPEIRINAVCPGPMWTENVRRIFPQHAKSVGISVEEYVKQRRAQIPAGRFLELDECAALIEYLLGPNSRFITGESIRIAGGEG